MKDGTTSGTITISNQLAPSFEQVNLIAAIEEETWMTPIRKFLQDGTLPSERNEVRKILRKASRYTIQEGILYRRGFSNPLLRCVAGREAKEILSNIHQGSCGDHTGGQTLAKKILRYDISGPP